MVIFPLAPDQTIAQMWSNGARGVTRMASSQSLMTTNQAANPRNRETISVIAKKRLVMYMYLTISVKQTG